MTWYSHANGEKKQNLQAILEVQLEELSSSLQELKDERRAYTVEWIVGLLTEMGTMR